MQNYQYIYRRISTILFVKFKINKQETNFGKQYQFARTFQKETPPSEYLEGGKKGDKKLSPWKKMEELNKNHQLKGSTLRAGTYLGFC